jgi:hypothetical protein
MFMGWSACPMSVMGLVVGPPTAGWAAGSGVMVAGRCNWTPSGPILVASWGRGVAVDALNPGAEQAVQLVQVGCPAADVQVDEELLAHGAEDPLDLAAALRLARPGVG